MSEMIVLARGVAEFPVFKVGARGTTKGGLIVIHEVWGLTDHIKDVAERFANEGYEVLAPDLMSGSSMDIEAARKLQQDLFNPEKRNKVQPKLRELMAPINSPQFAEQTIAQLKVCFDELYNQSSTNKKLGVVGFCFGGSYSFSLAVHEPRLKAAAPFYGHADFSIDELRKIKCPIQAFYGKNDESLVAGLPELKTKIQEAGIDFTSEVYSSCGHAFFNDTNEFTYNPAAAADSWQKVKDFLNYSLR